MFHNVFLLRGLLKSGILSFLVLFLIQGAFAAETQVTPSLTLQSEYNDNIFFVKDDEDSDYVLIIEPEIAVSRRTERIESRLRVKFPINHYMDFDELNAVDQVYSGNLGYRWSPRVSTFFQAAYIQDSQPDRDILETGLVVGDVTRRRLSAGFSGEYLYSELTSLALSYAYRDEQFKEPGFAESETQSINFILERDMERTFANTRGNLTFGYSRYDSDRSTVESYSTMVGAVRQLTELYYVSADIGVRYTRHEFDVLRFEPVSPDLFIMVTDQEKNNDWGVVGRASLSYQDESSRASLNFYRDVATSSGRTGAVERTALVFDIGKRFTYRFWGHFSAGYYLNESKGKEFSIREIDENTWRLNPYIRYVYSNDLSFRVSYSYTKVRDRLDSTDAERNLILLRLVYSHPLLN